jgi:hypothetical protein
MFQMSFEEDSNLPPPDLLSPDSLRRRRFQQQKSASNIKFENPETSNSKKVRFRKRAKSMVANTSADHVSAQMQMQMQMQASIT